MTSRDATPTLAVSAALAALISGIPVAAGQATGGLQVATVANVVIITELGEIELEIDLRNAPVTSRNFLRYVDAGLYASGRFYRTVRADNQPGNDVRIDVIQGGIDPSRRAERLTRIPLEGTSATGLRHLDGVISMARGRPDTASSEFFICLGDQPELDEGGGRNPDGRGFAAFGLVVRGMDVVRAIHVAPANGQSLDPPIGILRVTRTDRTP